MKMEMTMEMKAMANVAAMKKVKKTANQVPNCRIANFGSRLPIVPMRVKKP